MEAQYKGTIYHIGLVSRQQWSNNDSSPPILPPIIITQSQIHTMTTSTLGLSGASGSIFSAQSHIAMNPSLSAASGVRTPSHAATNHELQAAWRKFKKPVADENVLPASMDLRQKTGQKQLGDRKISWKIDEDGLRSVQYEIRGIDGTVHGGLKDQNDHDGFPETLFWGVNSNGSGFTWKRNVHEHGATVSRPWYEELSQVCALVHHDPDNDKATPFITGEGWASQVVPVDTADVHRLLGTSTSKLPVTGPTGGRWAQHSEGGVKYSFKGNEHGTTGTFIGPDFVGDWNFHKPTEGPRSVFVSLFHPGESKCGFGLQMVPGTPGISDGWFLPE